MDIYLPYPMLNLPGPEIYLPPSEIYLEHLQINLQRPQKPSPWHANSLPFWT